MVGLIQPAPYRATHFGDYIREHSGSPVDQRIKIGLQHSRGRVVAFGVHVVLDAPLAYPVRRLLQKFLSNGAIINISAPLLDVGIGMLT
jgi:hypothetical protein